MSVVAAQLYRNGKKVKAVTLDEPIDCKGKSEFVWIGLFENMPELKTQYGYYVVVSVIALLCTVLYLRFKRAHWL